LQQSVSPHLLFGLHIPAGQFSQFVEQLLFVAIIMAVEATNKVAPIKIIFFMMIIFKLLFFLNYTFVGNNKGD